MWSKNTNNDNGSLEEWFLTKKNFMAPSGLLKFEIRIGIEAAALNILMVVKMAVRNKCLTAGFCVLQQFVLRVLYFPSLLAEFQD